MNSSQVISTVCLLIVIAPQPAHAARPTLRNLRSNAHNEEQVRRSTYSEKTQKYQIFRNEALGFSVEYPTDWESSYVTAESLADEIVHFSPKNKNNIKSSFSVFIKSKNNNLTRDDLHSDFDDFVKQPTNDYQIRTMTYVHELKLIEKQDTVWSGFPVLYVEFEAGGVQDPYFYKQFRIAAVDTIYVLNFATPLQYAKSENPMFAEISRSFRLLPFSTSAGLLNRELIEGVEIRTPEKDEARVEATGLILEREKQRIVTMDLRAVSRKRVALRREQRKLKSEKKINGEDVTFQSKMNRIDAELRNLNTKASALRKEKKNDSLQIFLWKFRKEIGFPEDDPMGHQCRIEKLVTRLMEKNTSIALEKEIKIRILDDNYDLATTSSCK